MDAFEQKIEDHPYLDTSRNLFVPIINKKQTNVSDEEKKQYKKDIQNFFLYNNKPAYQKEEKVESVFMAPYNRGQLPDWDFPVLYDKRRNSLISLRDWLLQQMEEIFAPEDLSILNDGLACVPLMVQKNLKSEESKVEFKSQLEVILESFELISEEHSFSENFPFHFETFKKRLETCEMFLIGFSKLSAFHLLNLEIQNRNTHNHSLRKRIKRAISGLTEILMLQEEQSNSPGTDFIFAESLLMIEKVKSISLPTAQIRLSKERKSRIQACIRTLRKGENYTAQQPVVVISSQDLINEYKLEKTLHSAQIEIVQRKVFTRAKSFYHKEMKQFTETFAALRKAELEIHHQYEEDIHDGYFEHFDAAYLNESDLEYFRPILILERSENIDKLSNDLIHLSNEEALIKILAISDLDDLDFSSNGSIEQDNFVELSTFFLWRRTYSVFQGGAEDPFWLHKVIHKGLNRVDPIFWNFLIPKKKMQTGKLEYSQLESATNSRYFPRFIFDIRTGNSLQSRVNIGDNLYSENTFIELIQTLKEGPNLKDIKILHTIPYFFAACQIDQIEVLPPWYDGKELITLSEYYNLSFGERSGMIPFIWVIGHNNEMKRGTVPLAWIRRSENRIHFWEFLQDLSGVDKYFSQHELEEEKVQWEAIKNAEIEELKTKLENKFNLIREKDLELSIQNILNKLLEGDLELIDILSESNSG